MVYVGRDPKAHPIPSRRQGRLPTSQVFSGTDPCPLSLLPVDPAPSCPTWNPSHIHRGPQSPSLDFPDPTPVGITHPQRFPGSGSPYPGSQRVGSAGMDTLDPLECCSEILAPFSSGAKMGEELSHSFLLGSGGEIPGFPNPEE